MQLIVSLNSQANGFTVNIPSSALAGIITQYYTPDGVLHNRPAEFGDVYSFLPDGSWEGRPKGTAGAYEVVTVDGLFITVQPVTSGPVYRYALVNLS